MKTELRYFLFILGLLVSTLFYSKLQGQEIDIVFKEASVFKRGDSIVVNTGLVERVWARTTSGLRTISVTDMTTDKEWVNATANGCDWQYMNVITPQSRAELVSIASKISDDSGFTSQHIELTAEFYYPAVETYLKLQVRAYPGSTGLFTQLSFKGNTGRYTADSSSGSSGRVDFIPVNAKSFKRTYFGYYNDTQHRNKHATPLVKEEVYTHLFSDRETVDWSSGLCMENGRHGLIMIKESHKCVNQKGHDTGEFVCDATGVSNTGTSLRPDEILPDHYRKAWASWVVLYQGGEDDKELALKSFERFRFPVNRETDVYILANTWGSDRERDAATEANVLKEMSVQRYLGIDVQQIDDGYQMEMGTRGFAPGANGWYPVRQKFSQGFLPVREKANKYNMKLGLWFASMGVSLEEMKRNYDTADFKYYKLDFANLNSHDRLETMEQKIRAFLLYSNHNAKVNLDVTENSPRFGYFWAKEYGCIFLENRKPQFPENVVYKPYLVLRDLWHLSKYCNLNKFQGTIQNIDRVDTLSSDAYLYNHPYSVAIALMSTPLFFQETQFYSDQAKDQVRNVLEAYRNVRSAIYESYVYPIGDVPDNQSWSGFQAQHPTKNIGYITVFRELKNSEPNKAIRLRFIKNRPLYITDLMSGESFQTTTDALGAINLNIPEAAGFRFYEYRYD